MCVTTYRYSIWFNYNIDKKRLTHTLIAMRSNILCSQTPKGWILVSICIRFGSGFFNWTFQPIEFLNLVFILRYRYVFVSFGESCCSRFFRILPFGSGPVINHSVSTALPIRQKLSNYRKCWWSIFIESGIGSRLFGESGSRFSKSKN
jgi:hypothetical protein